MSAKRKRVSVDKRLPIEVKIVFAVGFALLVVFAVYAWRTNHPFNHGLPTPRHDIARLREVSVLGGRMKFHDVAAQSRQFINDYNTIHLTPAQEAVKAEALKSRPAACCMHSDAYTCCCTCNLSKTVWGLTNYAIVTYHINADQVQEVVDGWLGFINPAGYDGAACYRGECSRTGHEKGCGGMTEKELAL